MHGGRPRREQVRPDSPFGRALKEHIRRIEGLTQTDLAREAALPEKTLSQMVKGKRTSGTMLRRDLRAIITVLHRRGALVTREEADQLMTTLPAIKALDERDPDDADIIALFDAPAMESAQAIDATPVDAARLPVPALSESQNDRPATDGVPESAREPLQMAFSPPPEAPVRTGRETKQHLWQYAGAALVALIILGGVMEMNRAVSWWQTRTCPANAHGVTLYTDIQYQGHCATFAPGNYELARYGLEQNVSSIKDPDGAYHITLVDKDKNLYYVDADTPILPAEWDNRADTMLVEKNRPISCHPGSNGIIAFLDTDYSGGCLFITQDIPDLTPLDFDDVLSRLCAHQPINDVNNEASKANKDLSELSS